MQTTHTRRIMRAPLDAPSPFTGPVLATPEEPDRPVPPTAMDVLILIAPPPPGAATRRSTAIPELLARDVGGRSPDGREAVPAPALAVVPLDCT
jgi:hypothetical protein